MLGGTEPQREELEGAAQSTGSPKQLDPEQRVPDKEAVLTLLKPWDAVLSEVPGSLESFKGRYCYCLLPVNERGFRKSRQGGDAIQPTVAVLGRSSFVDNEKIP